LGASGLTRTDEEGGGGYGDRSRHRDLTLVEHEPAADRRTDDKSLHPNGLPHEGVDPEVDTGVHPEYTTLTESDTPCEISVQRDFFPPAPLAGKVAARDARQSSRPAFIPDALNPRSLIVEGESAKPLAEPGWVVVFDAGRPNEVKDGEPCVVEVGGEMVLKRRATAGAIRIYESIAPGFPPVGAIPVAQAGNEYPVVAVLHRARLVEGERPVMKIGHKRDQHEDTAT